jgi:hypothetical protein
MSALAPLDINILTTLERGPQDVIAISRAHTVNADVASVRNRIDYILCFEYIAETEDGQFCITKLGRDFLTTGTRIGGFK